MTDATQAGLSGTALNAAMEQACAQEGGWWPFDRFMAAALYTPGLGYYSRGQSLIGRQPGRSDFATAPVMSPLFGQALAVQVRQALKATGTRRVLEFGAGTGALALQLLEALGDAVDEYVIVDLSAGLKAVQADTLRDHAQRVRWWGELPEALDAVVVGNEVLDAMPVQLLRWDGERWWERGVVRSAGPQPAWQWQDRATDRRPPVDGAEPTAADDDRMDWARRFVPDTVVEVHPQAEAFMRSLAACLKRGAAFFIDYGFPEHEYYHRQRQGGTLMCHQAHRADTDPLVGVGEKDITAHVNFTAMALAAQDAGLEVLGYTSQARFLMNCGLVDRLATASLVERSRALPLITEHEMGELFKVLGLAVAPGFNALGFAHGDRSHTL